MKDSVENKPRQRRKGPEGPFRFTTNVGHDPLDQFLLLEERHDLIKDRLECLIRVFTRIDQIPTLLQVQVQDRQTTQ